MHTVTIELLRTGESHSHALSEKTKYIALCGSHPPVDLKIKCNQETFSKYKQMLRYFDADEKSRQEGIKFFEELITDLLDDIEPLRIEGQTDDWLHLRLVMTPKEMVQLPFELALTPKGFQGQRSKLFLMNPQRLTTLTREVRQVSSSRYLWPHKPRILFAWADPEETVPYEEHFNMLKEIVRYFAYPSKNNIDPVADIGALITSLERASLKSINDTVKSAIIEDKPYTHLHILAHGIKDDINGYEEYRLVLHDNVDINKEYYADGNELAKVILETENNKTIIPAVVSLMVCDSSNTGNISLPSGSIAHQLHESGIPCVFASQFPLSVDGSVKLVSTLYRKLLIESNDPREALYYTRKDLDDKKTHDWASLVAHVRFPEDIDEQLKNNRLKIFLEAMKTANKWAEHLLKYKDKIDVVKETAYFEEIDDRLNKAINGLRNLLEILEKGTADEKKRCAENYGLLASGWKRKAEHLFRMTELKKDDAVSLIKESMEALKSSRECYLAGYKGQKNHWTAVQYLSLQAIIKGTLNGDEDKDIWTVAKVFAEDDLKQSGEDVDKIWACGSLAELYLLKPLTLFDNQPGFDKEKLSAMEKAKEYIDIIANAKSASSAKSPKIQEQIVFALESTHLQFERYINWWPMMLKEHSSSIILLKKTAMELLERLSV